MKNKAAAILRNLFEAFPPLAPSSEFYDEEVDCADVVGWLGENAQDIREIIDQAEVDDANEANLADVVKTAE